MPRTLSAKKALRKDRRRKAVNLFVRQSLKKGVSTVRKQPTLKNLSEAFRALDQAAKKKVIHKGKANRLKSRLSKLINKKITPATPAKKITKKTAKKTAIKKSKKKK